MRHCRRPEKAYDLAATFIIAAFVYYAVAADFSLTPADA